MSRPDSCGTCSEMVSDRSVSCRGSCGLIFHPTCIDSVDSTCEGCRLATKIPPEIWTVIFNFLDIPNDLLKVRLVCRTWKQLVDSSPTLRNRLTVRIQSDYRLNDDPEIPPIAARMVIEVSEIDDVVDEWWPNVGPRLVSLELKQCLVEMRTLVMMLRASPQLKELALDGVIRSDWHVGEIAGAEFRLENLETLALEECDERKFVPTLTKLFTRMCPRLKNLAVRECTKGLVEMVQAVEGTLEGLKFEAPVKVLEGLTKLKTLKLKHVTLLKVSRYDRNVFANFFQAQPNIEKLTVCPKAVQLFNDGSLTHLKLVSLKVELVGNFTLNLGQIPTLKHLEIALGSSFCSPTPTIANSCHTPNLQTIHLHGLHLAGHSMANFLAKCPNLQSLSLAYLQIEPSVTLETLPQTFPALKTLKIDETHLSRPALLNLFRSCPSTLRDLELLGIPELQDDLVLLVVQKFQALKRLALDCNGEYGDSAEYIIKHHGPELRQLGYKDWSKDVSAETRTKLVEHFEKNRQCRVKFWWRATDAYEREFKEF